MTAPNAFRAGSSNSPRGKASRLRAPFGAILSVAFLLISPAVLAQSLSKAVWFDIEPQTLDQALLEFGRQAHLQIMLASESAAGRMRTQELKGRYTGEQALVLLLKRTGLTYSEHRNSIEVIPVRSRTTDSPTRTSKGLKYPNIADVQSEADIDPPQSHRKLPHETPLREVVITGSRLPTTVEQAPPEIQIYTSDQIDQSGQNSVADFLNTLPSFSVGQVPISPGIGTTVALRGLPIGTTLVLLDGRRLENSGLSNGDFFDLSNIPLAAIDRIEVDKSGASAVYGSDAIGGIVNIITKKDFNGLSINARYGWAKDLSTGRANIAWSA